MNAPKLRFKEFTDECKKVELDKLYEFKNGLNGDRSLYGKGVELINVSDILNNTYITSKVINGKININEDTLRKNSVEYGDILFQRSSETFLEIGTSNVYLDNKLVTFSGFVIRGKRKKDNINNPLFINYVLKSPTLRKKIIICGSGAQHYNIGQEDLKRITIFLPSIKEQKKIADMLELLDKKIELQTKKIEALKLFKKGLLKKIFSSVNNYKAFKNIATLKNGYTFKNNLYSKSGKYNIVTISNVTGNKYIDTNFKNKYEILPTDLQPHQLLKNNDILVSMTGNVGRVSLNRGYNNLLNQRVGLIVPSDDIDPFYLFYVLSDTHFEKSMINLAQGAAQANISKEDIDNYLVPILSKEKQKQIAKILNIYFKSLFLEQEKLNKLKILKKGLMQNMFV